MKSTPNESHGAVEKFETPNVKTIEELKAQFDISAENQIKTLVYIADGNFVLLLLRGYDQLEEAKLGSFLKSVSFRLATDNEVYEQLQSYPGSLGAVGVEDIRVIADNVLKGAAGMVTGANKDGFHLRNVDIERDIIVNDWCDLRKVKAGELCLESGNPLKIRRAIEVGHVFKLGTKYSESLGATVLNEDGKSASCIMGCYGIGVTRTLQAIIEQCFDENGINWPTSVAPYQICITALDVESDSEVMKLASKIYHELKAKGVDVILDDRPARPGIKFKDSELIGFPLRIGIGERSLAKGNVELKPKKGEMILCAPDETVSKALEWLDANSVN